MAELNLTSEPRPEWMTDAFLKTCIRNYQKLPLDADVYLDDIFITYVVPKGENYLSVIYRVKVQYCVGSSTNEVEESTLIVKIEQCGFGEVLSSSVFEREIEMYKDVLPQLHQVAEKMESSTRFVCRYIHSVKKDTTWILVLEDIKLMGYVVADRKKCLDLEHCKMILGKLAKMHAASMHYCNDQSDLFHRDYEKSPFGKLDEEEISANNLKASIKKKIAEILQFLAKEPAKYGKAIDYYKKYEATIEDMGIFSDIMPYEEGNKFNAIIHGDCWTNNIMFKYGPDSAVEDVLFVDFQGSNYTSIAYDFSYFIFGCANLDVRKTHYVELKEFYFTSLVSNLKTLGYQGILPTLEEYDQELKKTLRVVIFAFTMLLPVCLVKLDSQTLSRDESKTFNVADIAGLLDNVAEDDYFTKLVLASTDIMLEEKLFDAILPP